MNIYELINLYKTISEEGKEILLLDFCCTNNYDKINDLLEAMSNDKEISSEDLELLKKCYQKKDYFETVTIIVELNKEKYSNSFINYDILLNKLVKLSKELNLNTSLELSNLYTYMLWNGYFSKYKKHIYSTNINNRKILFGGFSFEIMNGNGVCLNYSEMLNNFLKKFGYSTATISGKLTPGLSRYIPPITRYSKKASLSTKFISNCNSKNLTANHASVLIEDKEKKYIYDPTNIWLLKLDNINQASIILGQGNFNFDLWQSYILNNLLSSKKMISDLSKCQDFSMPYDKIDFVTKWEENMDLFTENTSLLEEFYADIKVNIDQIVSDTQKVNFATIFTQVYEGYKTKLRRKK